jgi:hypothetical protein
MVGIHAVDENTTQRSCLPDGRLIKRAGTAALPAPGHEAATYTCPKCGQTSKLVSAARGQRPPPAAPALLGPGIMALVIGMRRAVVGLLLFAIVVMALGPAEAASSSRPALANGFRVAKGTRLLGGVVPIIHSSAEAPVGWSAVLWLDSDAVSAVNRYAGQAARLGFRGQPAECATGSVPSISAGPTGFVCRGSWNSSDARLDIVVTVCSACEHPTSTVVLDYVNDDTGSSAPMVSTTTGRTARLSSRQQARARRDTPEVGEPFTDQLTSAEFPSVARNSAAAAPSFSLGGCNGDAHAVLTVKPGKVNSVLAALQRQNTSGDLTAEQVAARTTATVNGATVTRAQYGYYTTLIAVDDPSRPQPFVTVEWCND